MNDTVPASPALDPDEFGAIRAAGQLRGADLTAGAGSCPYLPTDQRRHRAWMDGFSKGRVAARQPDQSTR